MRVALIDSIRHDKGFDIKYQTNKKFCGKKVQEVTEHIEKKRIPEWCPLP